MIRLPLLACLLAPVLIDLPTGCLSAQGLVSQTRVARNPQDPKTVTVIGRGIGLDLESAQKDALKSAVEKAVGLLLDAETILENDEIIETILTYSGAYIEKYETLETKKEDSGLFRVKIRAEVKKTQLEEKLVEEKLIKKKVDGKSLFAKARSKLTEKNSSALVFRKAFEGFPLGVLKASVQGEPEIVAEEEDSVKFGVVVRMEIDEEAWIRWVARLDGLLGPISRQKGTFRPSQGDVKQAYRNIRPSLVPFLPQRISRPKFPNSYSAQQVKEAGLPADAYSRNTFLFFVAKAPGAGQEWLWYQLARDPLLVEVTRVAPRYPSITVSVVGGDGTILAGKSFSSVLPYDLIYDNDLQFCGSPLVSIGNGYRGLERAHGIELYSGWMASSNAVGYNSNGVNMDASHVTMYACPAAFCSSTYVGDSYALPLLLGLPLSALEEAEDVEVRLVQKEYSFESITITTLYDDNTTRKTFPWKVPEEGSK